MGMTDRIKIKVSIKKQPIDWKQLYQQSQNPKYRIGGKNYSKAITGKAQDMPRIYIVPRIRTKSYKNFSFHDENGKSVDSEGFYYCEASKGFRFSDLSTYVAGPVSGHGINVLNAAWSCLIKTVHINGKFNSGLKNGWSGGNSGHRSVQWLRDNKDQWFDEWTKWSDFVRFSGDPSFHWLDSSDSLAWYDRETDEIRDYQSWWGNTYAKWLSEYYQTSNTYKFVHDMHHLHKRTVVIVHPIVTAHEPGTPITTEYIATREAAGEMMNAPFVLAKSLCTDGDTWKK